MVRGHRAREEQEIRTNSCRVIASCLVEGFTYCFCKLSDGNDILVK